MGARQIVLQTSSKSSHPCSLLSRQHLAPVSLLVATLMNLPASIANKKLTSNLNPLNAALTKIRGAGTPSCASDLSSSIFSIRHFPSPNSYGITSLAASPPLTPIESHRYKNHSGEGVCFLFAPRSLLSTKSISRLSSNQSLPHSFLKLPGRHPSTLLFVKATSRDSLLPVLWSPPAALFPFSQAAFRGMK